MCVCEASVIALPNMSSMRKRFPSDEMNKKYTVDKTFRDSKYGLIRNGVERDTGRCLRTETDDTFLYLVFENLPWDLDDFGRGQAKIENQVSIKHILQGILHGIEYLRSQNCVHEDLRPEFVLFDPDSKRVKVAYFGEPKSMDDLVNDWCLDNPDLAKEFPSLEPAGVDLISRMLCLDPDQRITPREALEHEYFKDL
ncbi:hypothetical protein Pint_22257 [Pistacia integerrima]|uniref:Uncharacterized protein n=1 Tax=Pistacia integerrima TaxID=434235 RepID=A0ACC0YHT1_9ROSI|nr:hypothetical protein Pint_22257 [Pistacia integerrima]